MYNISEGLKDAVKRKNMSAVRSRFFTLIARNPSGREISAYVDYCLSHGLTENEFYMPDSSENFKSERKEWTQEYWIELGSEMHVKFSKKHISHMIEVADYLFSEHSQCNSQDYEKKNRKSHCDIHKKNQDMFQEPGKHQVQEVLSQSGLQQSQSCLQSGSSANNVTCIKSKGDEYQKKLSPKKNVELNIEIKKKNSEFKEQVNTDLRSEDRNNDLFDDAESLTQIP